MSSIAVITLNGRVIEGLPREVVTVALPDATALPAVLAAHAAAVLVSDGFDADQSASIAAAITSAALPVIEVRAARWDGESPSPVSAACRGLISGFGDAGIAAAVRLLQFETR